MSLIFPTFNDAAQTAVVRKLTQALRPASVQQQSLTCSRYYYGPQQRIFFMNTEIK